MEDSKAIQLSRRNTLEQNKKTVEKTVWSSPEMKEMRESVQSRFGLDMKSEKDFPVSDPSFNWGKFRRKIMRETNGVSGNAQLLRAGVQTAVNNMYGKIPVTYDQWTHTIQSQKDTELYAPLNALTFLGELGEGEKYLESSVIGLDIKLRNKKFGQMLPVSFELLDDDQTGQFAQKVGDMAEYAALLWEVYSYGKLQGLGSCVYGGLTVPASETKPASESSYPWSASLVGGGATKPASFGAMTQANIQLAFSALEQQLNLQGLKMSVSPDKIISGTVNRWTLMTLLNSNFYPSGAAAAGAVGGSLAANVLQGIADPIISRFVFDNNGSTAGSKAWYVMDSSKPAFVVQMREAAKVTQENPEAGAGFERDIYRWKLTVRGNADFIDPRFFYQGNDGSV